MIGALLLPVAAVALLAPAASGVSAGPREGVESVPFEARRVSAADAVVGPYVEVTRAVEFLIQPRLADIAEFHHTVARLRDGRSLVFSRSAADPREVDAILVSKGPEPTAWQGDGVRRPPPAYVPRIAGYEHVRAVPMVGGAYLGLWRPSTGDRKPILVIFSGAAERCGLAEEWVEVGTLSTLPLAISIPVTAHGAVWNMSDIRRTSDGVVIVNYDWRAGGDVSRLSSPCPPQFDFTLEPIEFPLGNPPRLPPPPPVKRD